MTTIAEQIVAHASTRPDEIAVTCGTETLTWGALADSAGRMADRFAAHGAGPGSLVTIGLPNGAAFVQATVAAWWIGATPSPVSPKLPSAERRAIIELAAPALTVGVADEDAVGHPVLTADEVDRGVVISPPTSVPPNPWKAMPSGGSTGRPKLIVAEQEGSVDGIGPVADLLRLPTGAPILVPGPLSHNAPFLALSLGLMRGNHVILMPRFDAGECLRLAEKHAVRWLYQVPTMMLRIWRLPDAERSGRDVSTIDAVFHMAAPCPGWLKRAWIDWLGPDRILELYAGTELQAMTIVTGSEWLAHPGTVGRVHLGEIEIRDQAGARLGPGEIGEIWMRRSSDERAPYHYIGATPRAAEDNWESLGDYGHFDAAGYLHLADRAADMIIVGGSNVYPAEVEAALDQHPLVRSSCVIGLPDEDLGSVPHALVELAGDVTEHDLLAWVRARVASYKAPRSIERVDEPLRDDAGKVRRSQLRAARLATAN